MYCGWKETEVWKNFRILLNIIWKWGFCYCFCTTKSALRHYFSVNQETYFCLQLIINKGHSSWVRVFYILNDSNCIFKIGKWTDLPFCSHARYTIGPPTFESETTRTLPNGKSQSVSRELSTGQKGNIIAHRDGPLHVDGFQCSALWFQKIPPSI